MIFRTLLIGVLFSISVFATELKNIVMQDAMLSNGLTTFIKYQDTQYLVAVGISTISSNSIQAKINAIKGAKALAQSNLSKFINNTQVQSTQELIDKVIIVKNSDKIKRDVTSKYLEIIKEKGSGILKNTIDIGKWKIDNEYFYVLGLKAE
jgi:hypothetical protein